MFNSAPYGLSNPAFRDDIGMNIFNGLYPVNIDPINGYPQLDMGNAKLNNGQPDKDTLDKSGKTSKKSPWWKKMLIGGLVAGAGILAVYKGKTIYNFAKTYVVNAYNYLKTKISP